jgi:hypothetical protein
MKDANRSLRSEITRPMQCSKFSARNRRSPSSMKNTNVRRSTPARETLPQLTLSLVEYPLSVDLPENRGVDSVC